MSAKPVWSFFKGAGLGMMLGCVAGAVGQTAIQKNKKGLKKNIGKALHNMGELVDNVTGILG